VYIILTGEVPRGQHGRQNSALYTKRSGYGVFFITVADHERDRVV